MCNMCADEFFVVDDLDLLLPQHQASFSEYEQLLARLKTKSTTVLVVNVNPSDQVDLFLHPCANIWVHVCVFACE